MLARHSDLFCSTTWSADAVPFVLDPMAVLIAALEDVTVLMRVFHTCQGDLDIIPVAYNAARNADAKAVVYFDRHSRMMRRGPTWHEHSLLYWKYQVHLLLRGALHNISPRCFAKPGIEVIVYLYLYFSLVR